MGEETIFSKIIRKEIPADIVYQDEQVTVFKDISPKRPVHLLIIPNYCIPSMNEVVEKDAEVLANMMLIVPKLAQQFNLSDDGYRLIINCGKHGRQEVAHLHMHLVGGADCGPMLSATSS